MKVSLIMGSTSDQHIGSACVDVLKKFGVNYEVHIISAHRALDVLQEYCRAQKDDTDVYIAMAGKAAHLAGVLAGMVTQPVIGVPIKSSILDGLDALLSTVQMPSGIPVATVAIDGGTNSALLAIQILAIGNSELKKKLILYKESMKEQVCAMDSNLEL